MRVRRKAPATGSGENVGEVDGWSEVGVGWLVRVARSVEVGVADDISEPERR